MKKFLTMLAAAVMLLAMPAADAGAAKKVKKQEVVFVTTMDCAKCAEKVRENLSFEKGVLGLDVKLEDKTVKVVYNPAKTDPETLAKAIKKLGYDAVEKKAEPEKK